MTNQTIAELEAKIMSGGNVSAAELADAMRLADATNRINQLKAERTVRTAQSDIQQLAELKAEAGSDLTPFERLAIGNKIDSLEKKILQETNK
jgi:hypothetical protein